MVGQTDQVGVSDEHDPVLCSETDHLRKCPHWIDPARRTAVVFAFLGIEKCIVGLPVVPTGVEELLECPKFGFLMSAEKSPSFSM